MASNLGYILGNFALQNNPTIIGRQKRMGLGSMFGFDGSKDPNKSVIAQQAPSALSNPEANISDIIGGAIAKSPMSLAASQARDPSVDTSSLGNFGEVNSSAGTDVTGAQPKTTKGNFWDSKGGGILQSLLGVLALGGLGAGIGAISGGGRGALQGASYGMGFGALQDLALRKSAMEGAANEEKLQYDLEKAQLSAMPTSYREQQIAKQDPEYASYLEKINQSKLIGPEIKTKYLELATKADQRAEDKYKQQLKSEGVKAQDDIDNMAKLEFGIKNIYSIMKDTPYGKRASWVIPGASHISEGAASFDQNNALILSNFARFSGEKGVLTDQDIDRVKGALFSPLDTPKIVEQKKKTLDDMFALTKKKLAEKKSTLTGETDNDRQTQLMDALRSKGFEILE